MNTESDTINIESHTSGENYRKFLQSIADDVKRTSIEIGITPSDALQNIIECIHEDAEELIQLSIDNINEFN